jgi:EAL domain-containing protein (putative c-di-GMP-specific phosphodiesterase class I)
LFPDHAGDSAELQRCAQAALQDARARGVPGKVYDQALPALGTTEIHARDVDKAIRSSQFDLYFQPKVDLANGRLRGAEALLRWQHPKRGLVGPERVVAVAERSDVIHALTLWVLNVALRNCASWHQAGWPIHVFVNLSTVNLADHEFPMLVQRSLETWQLDPGVLQFEITETAAMDEREQVFRVLEDLTALGVSLSIDDFGTGFSSLAYLQKLPVREIKIDKSFVSQMLHRREDETIVRAIIQLAHSFGLQVTAEGIEDADTYARLQQLECDAAQGFHIARPMEAAAFLDYLEGRQDVPLAIPGRDPLIE